MERIFEWDTHKAESNYRKHGIQFTEAALCFDDPFALSEPERIEDGEQRWQTIGMVGGCLLILVAHTVCCDNDIEVVRIISARRVVRNERVYYEHS